ncbi:MAG: O-antigen translocase [Flavobacterium sp.]
MNFVKQLAAKPLLRLTSLNGISILIKIFIGFITSKIIAIFVGPSGMALVGNLRNFLTTIQAVSTLGFESGIVKYVAEQKNDSVKLQQTLSTVFISVFVVCGFMSLFLFFYSDSLNTTVFSNQDRYGFIFKALAFALPFYIGNIYSLAVINGFGKFKNVVYVNIIGSFVGLLVSVLLIMNYKTEGALLSIIITPSLLFVVSFFYISKEIAVLKVIGFKFFNQSVLKRLSSYSLMALFSAIVGPMIYLAIRQNIISTLGTEEAGFYEAMNRISSYYLLFVTSVVSLYFLPKLSTADSLQQTKSLFWKYYKTILPLFSAGLILIYFLRDFIIDILFTKEFLPVSELFFWQLLGDVFRAASLILGIQFYAKKLTVAYLITEIFSFSILYFGSVYLISIFKIEGVVMAYALTFFSYLLVLGVYFRKSLFS